MAYTRIELLEHKTPYELFDDGDAFAEHQAVLDNELSVEEKEELAVKIVADCPQDKLKNLQNEIQAIASPIPSEDDERFHSVINGALQVKIRLLNMLDMRNTEPHAFFLEATTPDLIRRFNGLAQEVLAKNEIAIAERLALLTPEHKRSKLTRCIHNIFKENSFSTEVNAAFGLRRSIHQLVGDNPEEFFTSRDFSRDNCIKFSAMLSKLLGGQEAEIGTKLAKKSAEVQQAVRHKLELLTTSAFNATDPFQLIAKGMKAKRVSVGASSSSMFGASQLLTGETPVTAYPSLTAQTQPFINTL